MKEYTFCEPKVVEMKTKVPSLDLKKLNLKRSSIFNLDDIDYNEFATFISKNNETMLSQEAKKLSKIKIMALK